jgi:hypothetical protein
VPFELFANQRQNRQLFEFAFGRAGLGCNHSRGDNHTDECETDHEIVHWNFSYVDDYRPNPLDDHGSHDKFLKYNEHFVPNEDSVT